MIEIRSLTNNDFAEFGEQLQKLESIAEYPYGDDFFRLDHGENYFAFFERLGSVLFHIALHQNRVIACAAGVLREINLEGRMIKTWYLCDLKVHPDFRGKQITTKLFTKNLARNYLKCSRGYAVSMNPADGKNAIVNLLRRLPLPLIKYAGKLNFYSFAEDQAKSIHPVLEKILGRISYLSLEGKKDLIMRSTNSRLQLFHIQHGSMAGNGSQSPGEKGTYMICAFENSGLDILLQKNFPVSATASIISHRMVVKDWNFILTSDI